MSSAFDMRFPQPLQRGRLIRRYKRFLADVAFEDGREETVHVANPGAMLGLAEPGMTVWVSNSESMTRKLPCTWELVETDGGLVDVNTLHPNRVVAEALGQGRIPEFAGYADIRAEAPLGEHSRVDFRLQSASSKAQSRPTCWLEVKGVTLRRQPGLAEWPDCVSARGARHVRELQARVKAGDRAVMLFVVQRTDCDRFNVAADLDPAYAQALAEAFRCGVEVLCYQCAVDPEGISLSHRLPWRAAPDRGDRSELSG